MRRVAILLPIIALPGCTGFGEFLDHTFTLPGANPNIPMTDSENIRRALGAQSEIAPLTPEPGNVWPGPQGPDPTLADLESQPSNENNRGFPPTTVPGAEPGLPAGRQPRPRGSSTPPSSVAPSLVPLEPVHPGSPPTSSVPGLGPQGQVVQTPQGPAVDAGGTNSYRQLTTPSGPGAIVVPNGNGTSTVIRPDGSVQTIPTLR